ncbi:MAG: hypothetical protein HOE62_19065 [Alphaproteobacteria bacterium]|jgi:hypothetical protein|nr:hypothetical protein [Alphaproteobacteria bacterium]MBT4020063.1 hypothetical protein [Alphaproteobacteria bacterium]MBT5161905.1 hypothetical protein [Alphaproteobacteria bacterium]MBT7746139.1 hypothetical protein [Alphaproteobacteria bacterium]
MIPQEIETQIHNLASYYALELPRSARDEFPETPEWISQDALQWVRRHYIEFSDMVVAAVHNIKPPSNI